MKLFVSETLPSACVKAAGWFISAESHEHTVEQAREKVELDVDVIHVERASSRVAQRDGVLQAVGPAPVEGVVFLPHLAIIIV